MHSRDDGPSVSSHKNQHDKHHHHHHHNKSTNSSSNSARKQPVETVSKQSHPIQVSSQAGYKNPPTSTLATSSSSHVSRQKPSSTNHQPPTSNDLNNQKSLSEDRTQHRQVIPEATTFNASAPPRPIDSQKSRMTSSQQPPLLQPPQQQLKIVNSDRHSQSVLKPPPPEYVQKQVKHPPGTEYSNRMNAASSNYAQPQQQLPQKKTNWAQQQSSSSHQASAQKASTQSHSIPNLSNSSLISNRLAVSQLLPSYNEPTKQNSASQPAVQNDFWFNDKLHETPIKDETPPRQSKSMFSPSPEHDAFEKTKLMMMSTNAKRNDSPKSEKQDRRSSTPNKREKRMEQSGQKLSQVERKLLIPKSEKIAASDTKKRPFSAIDDEIDLNRENKSRKTEKTEPAPSVTTMMKQPIETNPDLVKSLLQECYTSNNKFDSFGLDSPLDVVNTELSATLLTIRNDQLQVKAELGTLMNTEQEHDNGFEEELHKRNKSKKKKEKHRHKEKHMKKKKNHKSDRDERKDTSLKIILSKEKSDSKSSPEMPSGGLKIKIPIKDVNKTDLTSGMVPAPLKLKISKEKIGGFSNSGQMELNDSSSSQKKKSKVPKHGSNNNNLKDTGFQQQLSLNKVRDPKR